MPHPPTRTATDIHLYVVAYDIREPKRWRRVFKTMHGYGEWLQLSVFQCRLSRRRQVELTAALDALIHHQEDHVLILDLGDADRVDLRVTSLGKRFAAVTREPLIV
jgi:CRISPR-associated protein Cas2